MKRLCKDIDITSKDLCLQAIIKCMANRSRSQMARPDIVRLYKEYGDNDGIANMMIERIANRDLKLPPIRWEERIDNANRKRRLIGIEDIEQQLFDNLAFISLLELSPRVGEYQCTCLRGNTPKPKRKKCKRLNWKYKPREKGTVWGMLKISEWLKEKDSNGKNSIRIVVQMDLVKNYASIDHDKLMAFLRKHVANEPLLWLVETLISTSPQGLIIGSILSVILDALYLSQLYHYIMEDCTKTRKHRNGLIENVRLVKHALFFVDDISLYCTSAKNANMAIKKIQKKASELGLSLHEPRLLNVTNKQYQDILGFRIYRNHITMRRRNYLKTKRLLREVDKSINIHKARALTSMKTFVMYSDSFKFRRKYHVKRLLRKARRYVSNYDKSNLFQKTAAGCCEGA